MIKKSEIKKKINLILELQRNGIKDPKVLKVVRMKSYRFDMVHYLNDGTRIIPNLQTIVDILYSYDTFGELVTVAVSKDSYTVYND